MAIFEYRCPECANVFEIREEQFGTTLRCGTCRAVFMLDRERATTVEAAPLTESVVPVVPVVPPIVIAKRAVKPMPEVVADDEPVRITPKRPIPKPITPIDDDDDDDDRSERPQPKIGTAILVIGVVATVLFVSLGVIAYVIWIGLNAANQPEVGDNVANPRGVFPEANRPAPPPGANKAGLAVEGKWPALPKQPELAIAPLPNGTAEIRLPSAAGEFALAGGGRYLLVHFCC